MKCIIDSEIVLWRAPEGPLAAHVGPFARSLREQGYALDSTHRQVLLPTCFSRWLEQQGSYYAASAPIMRGSICDAALRHLLDFLRGERTILTEQEGSAPADPSPALYPSV